MTISEDDTAYKKSNQAGTVHGNQINYNYGEDTDVVVEKTTDKVNALVQNTKNDLNKAIETLNDATDEIAEQAFQEFKMMFVTQKICCKGCNNKIAKPQDIILAKPVDTVNCLQKEWKDDVYDVKDVLFQRVKTSEDRELDFFCCSEAEVETTPTVSTKTFYNDYDSQVVQCPKCKEQVGLLFDVKTPEPKTTKMRKFIALFPDKTRY